MTFAGTVVLFLVARCLDGFVCLFQGRFLLRGFTAQRIELTQGLLVQDLVRRGDVMIFSFAVLGVTLAVTAFRLGDRISIDEITGLEIVAFHARSVR